jgi:DNA-binding response OmpR family regulator
VRTVLLEAADRRLPFALELMASIGDDVDVIDFDAVAALVSGETHLIVVARSSWIEDDTRLCGKVDDARTGVPLLAISGPTPPALRTAALRAGADEFMSIPFEVEELSARAFALLRLSTRGGVLRAGPFVVDPVSRRILVGSDRVVLTLSEYDVFVALIASAGNVVTRRTLATRVGSTASLDSNIVDVLVSRIRDKLGAHAAVVETVRGVGYRFRSP